jgi:hypothetical protein
MNTLTPKGCVEVRKESQIAPKGVVDLLLEGRGATAGGHAEPRKARFPAQPEMRPNDIFY